jgi:hypothetical protein
MKTNRVIAAFFWYAALGLLLGVCLEGVGVSLAKGDVTLDQLVTADDDEYRQHFQRVVDHTAVAAKEVGFWVLPVLLAAGLGAFFAHTEHRDGTTFHFETKPKSVYDTFGDD